MFAANTVDYLNKINQQEFFGLPIIKSDINKLNPPSPQPLVATDTYDPNSVTKDSFTDKPNEKASQKALESLLEKIVETIVEEFTN